MFLDDPCYSSAVFSPDGACVATSHRDGKVRIWGVRTGQLMRRIKAHSWYWVNDVAFMPDGKGLLSGGGSGLLKYWNVSSFGGSDARSQMASYSPREVMRVRGPERTFSGHKVHFNTIPLLVPATHRRFIHSFIPQHSVNAIAISQVGRFWFARWNCPYLGHSQCSNAVLPQERSGTGVLG